MAKSQWLSTKLLELADRLEGPNADKVFVAKDYSIRQLIGDLREMADHDDAAWEANERF